MLREILLPPRRILSDIRYVPLKSGLAVAFALVLDVPLGNRDHVSSAFVSIMCVAPTVLLGLRRASVQFSGSVIGGIFGAIAMWAAGELRLPLLYAIAPAVIGAVFLMLALRRPEAVPVAAFTALFLPAMPQATTAETFLSRMLAISIGASSGFIVNAGISFFGYRSIFSRRLRVAEDTVLRAVAQLRLPERKREELRPVFEALDTIQDELTAALDEPGWAHTARTREILTQIRDRIDRYRRIVHLLYDALILMDEEELPQEDRTPFLDLVARHPSFGSRGAEEEARRTTILYPNFNRSPQLQPVFERLKRELDRRAVVTAPASGT